MSSVFPHKLQKATISRPERNGPAGQNFRNPGHTTGVGVAWGLLRPEEQLLQLQAKGSVGGPAGDLARGKGLNGGQYKCVCGLFVLRAIGCVCVCVHMCVWVCHPFRMSYVVHRARTERERERERERSKASRKGEKKTIRGLTLRPDSINHILSGNLGTLVSLGRFFIRKHL